METKMRQLIHKCQSYLLDLVAPRQCAGCNKKNDALCAECFDASFKFGASCVFCNFRNNTGKICPRCRKIYKPEFEKIFWAGEYQKALKNSVRQLKYKKRKELAEPLGKLIFKKFREYYPNYVKEDFLIIPIPLHPKKEYERGFNQAELLAKEFAKLSNIPIFTNMLIKSIDTNAQVETKNKEDRIKNLENAFGVKGQASSIKNKIIILIDDVTTTGATFVHSSCALKKITSAKIICLALAHGYG